MQRNGIHTILSSPIVYRSVQAMFSHKETKIKWTSLANPDVGARVLDIGCGTGETAASFGKKIQYVGIDISEKYVSQAQKDFGHLGEFVVGSISEISNLNKGVFNLVILKGVFHHLADDELQKFALDIRGVLAEDGRVVSLDPTFVKGRKMANFLAGLDRGLHVRTPEKIKSLLGSELKNNRSEIIIQNMPPYHRIMMEFLARE